MTAAHSIVPHLTTAMTGPLRQLESRVLEKACTIESWFREQWRELPVPFYASVDLRNAGCKIAPVDTNLFPAGFNNLNPAFQPLCIQAVQQAVERYQSRIDKILLIPENHTRNLFYLENLASLYGIIEKAGFEVRIGSLADEITEITELELPSGGVITLHPVQRDGNRVHCQEYDADLLFLNNDLSGGTPEILKGLDQFLTPPLALGWSNRLKSIHFSQYQKVAKEFAQLIDIDPWMVDPMFRNCGAIDFMKQEGTNCLVENVETLLRGIEEKYREYDVKDTPFVMVKADAGTYGMGVLSVTSPDDVLELNRKQRNKMAKTKEGQKVSKVIIQEGVYTYETWGGDDMVAEPVVYMMDHNVVGGFYRVHSKKGASENLNAPGMHFERLAFEDCGNAPQPDVDCDERENRFYTYGVVARLALVAAAREGRESGV